VAMANALQLEATRATPVLFRFNYDAMPSLKSLNLRCDLDLWLCDFDLWPLTLNICTLQCIACDVMKLCTKLERSQAIRGGVIASSIFDLMTLNMCYVLRFARDNVH